jgi:acetoin utilization protein AcuB
MEFCLRVGQEDGKSQFPVLENGKVVGIITATEIFSMAAQLIGAWDHSSGVTLQVVTDNPVDMNRIATVVDEGGARLQSIYPLRKEGEKHRRIVVRFETDNLDAMVRIFENEGFAVLEKNFRGKPVVNSNDA